MMPVMARTEPSGEELLQRARELDPILRGRAEEAAKLRRIPDETIADFQRAGFFRMLQPSRWGGLEVDPKTFFEVQIAVAEACPSSAWVLGVVAVHAWQLALFPAQAQDEVWGDDASILISSSYAPTGKVERVDGGFRITGRWSFSSGCDHCQWVFVGGFVPVEAGKPPDMRTFLLPRSDYRIEDNWHVAGLVATGSKEIVVENAFVPEHRTHRFIDGFKCQSPGNAENDAPLYHLPFGQIFVRSVSTTAIGAAQGALATYREGARRKRLAASDGSKVLEDRNTQVVCARASSVIDRTRLVLHRNMGALMDAARAGETLSIEQRAAFRYDSSMAVQDCVEVVDDLFVSSGGRAIFLGSPILRYFLDIHAVRAHYANNPEKPARNYGGVLLELRNQDFFL